MSSAKDTSSLALQFRQFLEDVELLITRDERKAFMALDKDYQREAFVREFWKARDPYPETLRNEFEIEWRRRLDERKVRYPHQLDDRGRIYQLHGEPRSTFETSCGLYLLPLQIWYMAVGKNGIGTFTFIFVQPASSGPFRLWRPSQGFGALLPGFSEQDDLANEERFRAQMDRACTTDAPIIHRALTDVEFEDRGGELEIAQSLPEKRGDNEWLASFRIVSTEVGEGDAHLNARLERIELAPGRNQHVRVRALLAIPSADATATEIAGSPSYEFLVTGELIKESELFDSFRVRFDLPVKEGAPPADLPLTVERELRPGQYRLVLKLEELASKKAIRFERDITVEASSGEAATAERSPGAESTAAEALLPKVPSVPIRLLRPAGDLQSGTVRIDTEIGDPRITKVTFQLEDKPILTKGKPPYSVELNLGTLPASRTVRALAYDATGTLIGSDELALNPGGQRFAVRLLEPRPGLDAGGRRSAEAEIKVPDGEAIDRLELFVDEQRVATLYQPPWLQPIDLPAGGAIVSVRALAYLTDGRSAEDLVVLNAPGEIGHVEVRLVELPVEVHDATGHAVAGLTASDFSVTEDGAAQELLRCDRVENLPIRAALLLDTSASMESSLGQVQQAAGGFLRGALRPGDRAALLRFSEKPVIEVPFTAEVDKLVAGLAGLSAERSTALFDSLIFALDYMKGLAGPRALLVLTDGGDKSSRFDFDQTLEAARRSGVVIYAIGLALPRSELAARHNLEKLAEATGGLALFPNDAAELGGLYQAIDRDLRARWLLSYQSTQSTSDGKFRRVEVALKRLGLEIKAPAGYAP
ncbi:MAG TPA: VWA domain-containing protein [Thermoanaerobaculia bacterium]|nr:VWA domain-containing protein [Thermoanaerobaculia bacterium]